jgi:hypothetical protein
VNVFIFLDLFHDVTILFFKFLDLFQNVTVLFFLIVGDNVLFFLIVGDSVYDSEATVITLFFFPVGWWYVDPNVLEDVTINSLGGRRVR